MKWVTINKKWTMVLAFAVLALAGIWFLLNYTWVTFSYTSDEEVFISIRDSSQDSAVVDEFTLKNESKRFLLKRSSYRVEASGSDKLSRYRKSLGYFRDNVDIELLPQQKSIFLGKSLLPCAKEMANEVLFSSCAPKGSGNTIISSKRGSLFDASFFGPEGESFFATGVLKNYKDGYLVAWYDGELKITARETAENHTISVPDFEGEINSNHFATTLESDIFVVYDELKEEVLVFSGSKDSVPARISLSKEIESFDHRAEVEVFASEAQVNLIVRDAGALADFSHKDPEEDLRPSSLENINPRLITVDLNQNKVSQVRDLSEDFVVKDVAATSPSGDMVLLPATRDTSPLFFDSKGKSVEADFLQKDVSGLCWESADSFYYLVGSSQQIYKYSMSKQASFLVYGGLVGDAFIDSVMCDQEKLYFTIKDQNTSEFGHFTFSSEAFSGARLEGALPMIIPFGSEREVINVGLSPKNTVLIKTLFNSGKASEKKAKAKQLVIDELVDKGVEVESLNFKFSP